MLCPTSIAIGCDETACELKDILKTFFGALGFSVEDFDTFNRQVVVRPDMPSPSLRGSVKAGTPVAPSFAAPALAWP